MKWFFRIFSLTVIYLFCFSPIVWAADDNFVTPVFPVRDSSYWRQGPDPKHFMELYNLVKKSGLASTWLIHYDVLDSKYIDDLKQFSGSEVGLFLEVTRKLAQDSFVKYDWEHNSWSSAYRIFLSGYEVSERKRMIDTAFSAFKNRFGYYPSAYGAWYVDVTSMEYIKSKYGAAVILGLADQYSTDGYQTWGQYLNGPYYVSRTSAIEPARDPADSTGILKLQWAPREPTLGFGAGVSSSNYSVQVNDYQRGQGLDIKYFRTLLEDLTVNTVGPVSQVVIGIEVGELEERYLTGLQQQLVEVSDLVKSGRLRAATMSDFYKYYSGRFASVSPPQVLGSASGSASIWWYFDQNYRVGISTGTAGAEIVDLRFYHLSDYRDNDQTRPDTRPNLVRLVPAQIDRVVLGNQVRLTDKPVRIEKDSRSLKFFWSGGQLIASSSGLTVSPASAGSALLTSPDRISVSKKGCHDEFGGFAGRFPCLKKWIAFGFSFLPDLVFSKINRQIYLGFRTGFETVFGIRLPKIKLGNFSFDYSVLDNFISLKKKLTPRFTWEGKQELELKSSLNQGERYSKGLVYGQSELLKVPAGRKVFENSYYAIFTQP